MDYLVLKGKYGLLGRDFLTWLFYRVTASEGRLAELDSATEVFFDDAVTVLGEGDQPAASSFRGDPASMDEELTAALKSGKKITRAKLHVLRPEGDCTLQLDADEWTIRGLRFASNPDLEGGNEAMLLDRVARLEGIEEVMRPLFDAYLNMRMDEKAYGTYGKDLASWLAETVRA